MTTKSSLKTIQFVGTRDKSDFVLYFAHVLDTMNKRVLIVDSTKNEWYRHSYTRFDTIQKVFDFQGIDILCSATNWMSVEKHLAASDEALKNYDVILLDMDTKEMLEQDWPVFDERFYIGDFDRAHQFLDVELLNKLFEVTGTTELKRITFESNYHLNESYFETLLNQDVLWKSMNYLIEPDDMSDVLRQRMQHDHIIPFKQLNKQYKELLSEIISDLYGVHVKDVADAVRKPFFKNAFKRSKRTAIEGSHI